MLNKIDPFHPQPLFPRKDSLAEMVAYAASQLPITQPNQLVPILGMYHNTMLFEQAQKESVQ